MVCFEDLDCVLFRFDGDTAVYAEYNGSFTKQELREYGDAVAYTVDEANRLAWRAPGMPSRFPKVIKLSRGIWAMMRSQNVVSGSYEPYESWDSTFVGVDNKTGCLMRGEDGKVLVSARVGLLAERLPASACVYRVSETGKSLILECGMGPGIGCPSPERRRISERMGREIRKAIA